MYPVCPHRGGEGREWFIHSNYHPIPIEVKYFFIGMVLGFALLSTIVIEVKYFCICTMLCFALLSTIVI